MSTIRELHEMKAEIARRVGTDPERYGSGCAHKRLLANEVKLVSEQLGMNLSEEPCQHVRDALMIRSGRDHRTGISFYDSRDVEAILNELEANDV